MVRDKTLWVDLCSKVTHGLVHMRQVMLQTVFSFKDLGANVAMELLDVSDIMNIGVGAPGL